MNVSTTRFRALRPAWNKGRIVGQNGHAHHRVSFNVGRTLLTNISIGYRITAWLGKRWTRQDHGDNPDLRAGCSEPRQRANFVEKLRHPKKAFKRRNMVLEMQAIANIIYGTGGSEGRCSANSIDSEQTPS
jgi:hypothetical protein